MRFLLCLVALSLTATATAADFKADDNKWFTKDRNVVVVKAFYSDPQMLQNLADMEAIWTVDKHKGYAVVEIDEFEHFEMIKQGFRLELDRARTEERHAVHARGVNQRAGIDGFECYRTVTETFASAAQLATDYPNLTEWVDIGDSWEKQNGVGGHDLQILVITNKSIAGDKPKLFSMSAIHAREYTTAELNTRFAEYLLENYQTNADARWIVDHHEIHLSLQSNPDGREQAQTGDLWRKNTNQNYCGATSSSRGADLNRNFDFGWGCCGGSSNNQCSDVYRGAAPGSEPEVAAIQDYLIANFPDQRGDNINDAVPVDAPNIFLDIHSFSQLVLYPWGFAPDQAPNHTGLRTLARKFSFFNNYRPEKATESFVTDGTTDDFAYGELGLAAYTFELGTTFFQDCATFESTIFPDNLQALVYAAKASRLPYQAPAGPDVLNVSFASNTLLSGEQAALSATVSDGRYNNSNGTEPVQNIASARAYINVPPWAQGAVAVPMNASDGGFNSNNEEVQATLDTTGLADGEHIVYIEASDAAGNTGVVSAQFLYIVDPATSPKISGTVTAADTGAGIAASVTAGSFQTTSDPATGAYELLVFAGEYTVTATPTGDTYGANSVSAVTTTMGNTTTVNFALFPFCSIFEDDAESGGIAWSTTGNWARTSELSNSPTQSWTDSPGGQYGNDQNVSLTSPAIDMSGVSAAQLNFAQICATEATYDFCVVEISSDGANFSEIARFDESSGTTWAEQSFDVSSIAGSANARIRFRMTTDVTVTRDGWHVDDIAVRASGAQCVTTVDTDADGVSDNLDNCTLVSNASQLDVDGDNFGNACDADFNNDGVTNFLDVTQFSAAFLQTGVLETDLNGDGVVNFVDLITLRGFFLQPPGPSGLVDP